MADRKLNRYETPFAKGAQSVIVGGIRPEDVGRELQIALDRIAAAEPFTPEYEYHQGRKVALELRKEDAHAR